MPGIICKIIICEDEAAGRIASLADPTVRNDLVEQGLEKEYVRFLEEVSEGAKKFLMQTVPKSG